jgi:hypothetical protein
MTVYILVENIKLSDMVDEVNNLIAKGFEPLGGVSVSMGRYIQAMTKDMAYEYISDEFVIKEKGIVPGETGPEYHFTYEWRGKRGEVSLGKDMKNYTDEELFNIVKKIHQSP